jgi:hypothetical protein
MAEDMPDAAPEQILLARVPPKSPAIEIGGIIRQRKRKRYAQVMSVVMLHTAWPGLLEPDEPTQTQIIHRVGRWCVLDNCMICLSESGVLTIDFLDAEDCFYHFLKKTWLYDPSDLLFAMEFARAQFFPHEEPAQRAAVIDRQLRFAIERRRLVFHPSALHYRHIYLVNRMTPDDERVAFGQFLMDKGFEARDWTV